MLAYFLFATSGALDDGDGASKRVRGSVCGFCVQLARYGKRKMELFRSTSGELFRMYSAKV